MSERAWALAAIVLGAILFALLTQPKPDLRCDYAPYGARLNSVTQCYWSDGRPLLKGDVR